MTICLASCRTETVLSSITAIPSFNIFLFADTGYKQSPWPWVVSFPPNLSSHFLKFDVLAITSSPNTFPITSMVIYVMPPQIFFLDRTSPTSTLPWDFSIIWKLKCIILICQDLNWGDLLCIPFCDGKICWTVIRFIRWMHHIYCGFTFL